MTWLEMRYLSTEQNASLSAFHSLSWTSHSNPDVILTHILCWNANPSSRKSFVYCVWKTMGNSFVSVSQYELVSYKRGSNLIQWDGCTWYPHARNLHLHPKNNVMWGRQNSMEAEEDGDEQRRCSRERYIFFFFKKWWRKSRNLRVQSFSKLTVMTVIILEESDPELYFPDLHRHRRRESISQSPTIPHNKRNGNRRCCTIF